MNASAGQSDRPAQHDRHFRLVVEDRGPGVPPDFAPHLFERFKRGCASNEGGVGGAGLGPSIAQAYAHAYGGELLYEDASPRGARFQLVVLPREPDWSRRQGLGST